jgi:serine/threonine-protein kinase
VPRDADWAPYRVVHDVPLDAEVMYYGFALCGGGDVWIDDVRISIVDDTAALTSSGSVVGNQNIAIDSGWILPEPLNLDFEFTSEGPTGGGEALQLSCTPKSTN